MRLLIQSSSLTACLSANQPVSSCQLLCIVGQTFVCSLNQNGVGREWKGALRKEQQCFPRIARFMLADICLVFMSYYVTAVPLSALCASPLILRIAKWNRMHLPTEYAWHAAANYVAVNRWLAGCPSIRIPGVWFNVKIYVVNGRK